MQRCKPCALPVTRLELVRSGPGILAAAIVLSTAGFGPLGRRHARLIAQATAADGLVSDLLTIVLVILRLIQEFPLGKMLRDVAG